MLSSGHPYYLVMELQAQPTKQSLKVRLFQENRQRCRICFDVRKAASWCLGSSTVRACQEPVPGLMSGIASYVNSPAVEGSGWIGPVRGVHVVAGDARGANSSGPIHRL